MAKWALVNRNNGGLTDICDEADKFDVYDGSDAEFKWCEVTILLVKILEM